MIKCRALQTAKYFSLNRRTILLLLKFRKHHKRGTEKHLRVKEKRMRKRMRWTAVCRDTQGPNSPEYRQLMLWEDGDGFSSVCNH